MSVKIKFFSSSSCKYCPAMQQIVEQTAIKYGYPVEVVKREEDIDQFIEYNVVGLPTVMILHKDKPVWSATGTATKSRIDAEFSKWSF